MLSNVDCPLSPLIFPLAKDCRQPGCWPVRLLLRMCGTRRGSGPRQQRRFTPDKKKYLTFLIPKQGTPWRSFRMRKTRDVWSMILGSGSQAQCASDSPPRETESGRGSQESAPIHMMLMDFETLWDAGFYTPLGAPNLPYSASHFPPFIF